MNPEPITLTVYCWPRRSVGLYHKSSSGSLRPSSVMSSERPVARDTKRTVTRVLVDANLALLSYNGSRYGNA